MEKSIKNLKSMSWVVLGLAGLTLLNIIFELFFGELNAEFQNATLPDGSPDNVVLIAQIFILALTVLMLLPQVYIGIKGIKVANCPDSSRGHIIWGVILFVFTVLELLPPALAFIQGDGGAFENVAEFLSILADAMILFGYVKFAIAVRNGN